MSTTTLYREVAWETWEDVDDAVVSRNQSTDLPMKTSCRRRGRHSCQIDMDVAYRSIEVVLPMNQHDRCGYRTNKRPYLVHIHVCATRKVGVSVNDRDTNEAGGGFQRGELLCITDELGVIQSNNGRRDEIRPGNFRIS